MPLGPNLLDSRSSDFETGTGGDWSNSNATYGTFTVTLDDAHSGTKSFSAEVLTSTYYAQAWILLTGVFDIGGVYRFGGWAKKAAGSPYALANLGGEDTGWIDLSDGTWHEFSVDWTANANDAYATFFTGFNVPGNKAYFDGLYISQVFPDGTYPGDTDTVTFSPTVGWFSLPIGFTGFTGTVNLNPSTGWDAIPIRFPYSGEIYFDPGPGWDQWSVIESIEGATAQVAFDAGAGDPLLPVFVNGATAQFSVSALPGIFTVGSALVVVSGATALATLSAGAAVSSVPTNLSVLGATAQMTCVASVSGVLTATSVPGDFRLAPIPIVYTGLTGINVQSFHPNLYTSTIDPDEPSPGILTASVWYSIWSDRPLSISVAYSGAASSMDLFDPLFEQVSYSGSFYVQANTMYYLRAGAVIPSGVAEFILTATPVLSSATIDGGTVNYLPGTITINGGGFPPNVPVTISMSGGTIATVMSDAAGSIVPTDVRLMAPLLAGTYSITGDAGSVHATGTLTVLNDPLPLAVTTPSDAAPSIPSGSHWRLQDPYTGTGVLPDFTFITNPSEMGSPHAPQNFLVDKTTAGVPHIWEGAARAYEWTFSGVLETQAEFDALSNYRKIGRRFFLRDHRNRIWTVTFTSLDVQPLRVYPALMSGMHVSEVLRHAPWAHKYTVQALIYSGPVMAS